ncbi:MAG: hypothetical protein AB9869_03445 [Verrucomicrobiia bacterium]
MNTKVDIKSALLGLLLGVIATAALGAVSSASQVGRYQIGGTSNQGLVIDTVTGRVWSAYFGSSAGTANKSFFEPKNAEKE